MFKYILPLFVVVFLSCDGRGGCEVNELSVEIDDGVITVEAEVEHNVLVDQYNWEFSDGFQIATLDPYVSHIWSSTGNHSVFLDVELTNGNFCELEEEFFVSNTIQLKDSCDLDIVSLIIDGNQVELEVEIPGDEDDASFWWDFGDGNVNLNSDETNSNVYGEKGSFNIKIGYEGLNGCKDTTKRIVHIDTLIFEDEHCSVDFDVNPIVSGKTVSLIAVTENVTGNESFHWDMGDAKPGLTTSSSNYIYSFSSPGLYDIKVTLSDGNCSDNDVIQVYIP